MHSQEDLPRLGPTRDTQILEAGYVRSPSGPFRIHCFVLSTPSLLRDVTPRMPWVAHPIWGVAVQQRLPLVQKDAPTVLDSG